MIIAGHQFVDGIHGLTCQACGWRFSYISGVQRTDIGKNGWAEHGALNEAEYNQIRAEVERQWGHLVGVASGEGIGGMAAGTEETS